MQGRLQGSVGLRLLKEDAMISCDVECSSPGPQWWEEAMHCRQSTRILNLDVQVRHGPIAHPRHPPARLIDLEYMDGLEKGAKVADLRRVRRARERRARRLAV